MFFLIVIVQLNEVFLLRLRHPADSSICGCPAVSEQVHALFNLKLHLKLLSEEPHSLCEATLSLLGNKT